MIPGDNLLQDALELITPAEILYFKAASRALNTLGQYVTVYNAPITLKTSFQPVPKNLYHELGLDLNRTYFTLYAPANIIDTDRNVSGDQVSFQGIRFQCESVTEWFAFDGWNEIRCVKL